MKMAKKLFLFDMDSTLINEEVIDLIAAEAGVADEVAQITNLAMEGVLDFKESLQRRVLLLKDLDIEFLEEVRRRITFTNGAPELITAIVNNGHIPAVVSGGFTSVISPLLKEIGILNLRANNLEIENGRLTGRVIGEVIDRKAKAETLKDLAKTNQIDISETIAIGDGANDIDMVKAAGLGIAFCAKAALVEVADVSILKRDLREILKYVDL